LVIGCLDLRGLNIEQINKVWPRRLVLLKIPCNSIYGRQLGEIEACEWLTYWKIDISQLLSSGIVYTVGCGSSLWSSTPFACSANEYNIAVGDLCQDFYWDGRTCDSPRLGEPDTVCELQEIVLFQTELYHQSVSKFIAMKSEMKQPIIEQKQAIQVS